MMDWQEVQNALDSLGFNNQIEDKWDSWDGSWQAVQFYYNEGSLFLSKLDEFFAVFPFVKEAMNAKAREVGESVY